jgi:hypothetical protein
MPATRTPPRPTLALRVGVTGHRLNRLQESKADIEGIKKQLKAALTKLRSAAEHVNRELSSVYSGEPLLYLISPLAEGADQFAADAALGLGYKLHVPLPCLAKNYTAGFQAPKQPVHEGPIAAFHRLIDKADSVQVLDGGENPTLDGVAYAEVGRTMLRHTDILLAVWDGEAADGAGGTGEIVAQAREWQVPTIVINPSLPDEWQIEEDAGRLTATDVVSVVRRVLAPPLGNEEDVEHAKPAKKSASPAAIAPALLGYLNTRIAWGIGGLFAFIVSIVAWDWQLRVGVIRLGRVRVTKSLAGWDTIWTKPTPLDPDIVNPLNNQLREYFAWADGLADRFGTLHRDFSTAPYALALVAVFVSLFLDQFAIPVVKASLAFVVAFVTVVVYFKAIRSHYHDRWIDYRSLAEELRHLAFLWPLGRPLRTAHLAGESATEASRFAWIGWYARALARQGGLYPGTFTPDRIETWRRILIERFLEPQRSYHERTADRSDRVQERLHNLALILFILALVLSAAELASALLHWYPLTHSDLWAAPVIAAFVALAALFPSIAATLHAFSSQGDFWNLSRRSGRMSKQLTELIASAASTPPTIEGLGNVAEDASDIMRDEVLNWRVFVRLKPPGLG